jgi:hypothetical protein
MLLPEMLQQSAGLKCGWFTLEIDEAPTSSSDVGCQMGDQDERCSELNNPV